MFPSLDSVANSPETHLPTIISSLCMNCYEQGETRLLLTVIPFFREVILSSFECDHCGYKTTEAQPGGSVQEKGCRWTFVVTTVEDMNRQLVKSNSATVSFKELDFEIPAKVGKLTTIEGLLQNALGELQETQKILLQNSSVEATEANPDSEIEAQKILAEKLTHFMPSLALALAGAMMPLTVVVDDPAGNSFIENPYIPKIDPNLSLKHYVRTKEQNETLGLTLMNSESMVEGEEASQPADSRSSGHQGTDSTQVSGYKKKGSNIDGEKSELEVVTTEKMDKEHLKISSNCPNCLSDGFSEMCITDIPFFKEIIIFAFNCEKCGFRSNEIKGGGKIPEKGKKLILKVLKRPGKEAETQSTNSFELDMMRDVVKSTSAGFFIPEIDLEVTHGSLGGMYTTVEGLLRSAYEKLFDCTISDDAIHTHMKRSSEGTVSTASFVKGDSAPKQSKDKFEEFRIQFDQVLKGDIDFTFILDDPLDNSFIYSPTAPAPEERLSHELYERTFDQNEEFGLNDMNTENYYTESDASDSNQRTEKQKSQEPVGGQLDATETVRKMRDLQAEGKEAHPNRNVVGRPEGF